MATKQISREDMTNALKTIVQYHKEDLDKNECQKIKLNICFGNEDDVLSTKVINVEIISDLDLVEDFIKENSKSLHEKFVKAKKEQENKSEDVEETFEGLFPEVESLLSFKRFIQEYEKFDKKQERKFMKQFKTTFYEALKEIGVEVDDIIKDMATKDIKSDEDMVKVFGNLLSKEMTIKQTSQFGKYLHGLLEKARED